MLTGIYFSALQNTLNSGRDALRELRGYENRFKRVITTLKKEKDNRSNIDLSVAALLYEAILVFRLQAGFSGTLDSDISKILMELSWSNKFKNLIDCIQAGDVSSADADALSLIREIENRRRSGIDFKKSLFRNSLYTVAPLLQKYWEDVGGAKALQQYEGLTQLYYTLSQEFGQQDLLEDFD